MSALGYFKVLCKRNTLLALLDNEMKMLKFLHGSVRMGAMKVFDEGEHP